MLDGDEVQWQAADRRPATTDFVQSVLSTNGDHATLQVVRYNSGVASLKPKWSYKSGRSQMFHQVRRMALLGIDAHSRIWILLSSPWKLFLAAHLLIHFGCRNYSWKCFFLPLEWFLHFLPHVEVNFPQIKLWSSISEGVEGMCAFLDAPDMSNNFSVPLLLSLMFLGSFLTTSSGWWGRCYSWDIMD